MSPSKGEKVESKSPTKQSKKQEPKKKILDHGLLEIPMIENSIGGIGNFFKLPKYKPRQANLDNTDDNRSSPQKSDAPGEEQELQIYDKSVLDHSKTSSSIHTDPSMKNYDYMIEPE